MELALVHKQSHPAATRVEDIIDPVKTAPQILQPKYDNAPRDKCLTNIFLSSWPRILQLFVGEIFLYDQALQRVTQEIRQRASAQREEQERRTSVLRLYCFCTSFRLLRVLTGVATNEDVGIRLNAPAYADNSWGLKKVELKERACWTPLGRVLEPPLDEDSLPDVESLSEEE